jgi:manganese transport protein
MNLATSSKSLINVHASVDPANKISGWRKLFAFFGPAYMVSVGYMDPGNWATDIEGGSKFGYALIWVLLLSNIMALLLQSLSSRLGIVRGRDLAQCSREVYPPAVNMALYILAEIAIAACDLAEVLGMAIGLNLLCGVPLIWGVVLTLLDTILLLYLQNLGIRKLEAFIVGLIVIIGGCFLIELFLAKPQIGEVVKGFVPVLHGNTALYIAIGIIGATVMPHNLYLHSALVQTRKIGRDDHSIRRAINFNTLDSGIALNLAFFVNAAILILAGTVFFNSGNHEVASLQDAHKLLAPLLGTKWASILFAIALIAAGQSSTITGTMAGQVVMEGYLRLRINPVVRRLITRLLAIVPALIVMMLAGDSNSVIEQMLIFSQVLLSMQLAFAVIPLIHFVSNKAQMGKFAIKLPVKIFSWLVAALILVLNFKLLLESMIDWQKATNNIFVQGAIVLSLLAVVILLFITFGYPILLKRRSRSISVHNNMPAQVLTKPVIKQFNRIALALDYSDQDQKIIQYALALGRPGTKFILIHIVESVSARMMENEAADYETLKDSDRLSEYVTLIQSEGYYAEGILGFKKRTDEIARITKETDADLLIIGSHGHRTAMDWIWGETINSVRHLIDIPVFIAR